MSSPTSVSAAGEIDPGLRLGVREGAALASVVAVLGMTAETAIANTTEQSLNPNTPSKVVETGSTKIDFATFAANEKANAANKKSLPASKNPSKANLKNCRSAALKTPDTMEVQETKNSKYKALRFVAGAINKACNKYGKRGLYINTDVSGAANDRGRRYKLYPKPLSSPIIRIGNNQLSGRKTYNLGDLSCGRDGNAIAVVERIDLRPSGYTFFVGKDSELPKSESAVKKLGKANYRKLSGKRYEYCNVDNDKPGATATTASYSKDSRKASDLICRELGEGANHNIPKSGRKNSNEDKIVKDNLDSLVVYGRVGAYGCDPNDQRPSLPTGEPAARQGL